MGEQPYVGQIELLGFNFAPSGWALCNGQLLAISQYATLFNLIGTTYGGDGQNTFALPDLRGRVPVGSQGGSIVIGQLLGTEQVTLTAPQIPTHNHAFKGVSAAGNSITPVNAVPATSVVGDMPYDPATNPDSTMSANAVAANIGNQPHENRMPSLAMNYCISLFGVFPSRN